MSRPAADPWLPLVGVVVMLLLYLPLLAIAVASFNASRSGMAWQGFTVQWYAALFDGDLYRRLFDFKTSDAMWSAAWNSLVLAGISTVIATVFGTGVAVGLARAPWPRWFRTAADLTLHLPVVTPDIALAVALVTAFVVLRPWVPWLEPGMIPLVIGHVTFEIPFVALVVAARLRLIGRAQEEAARDLYAGTWTVLRRVLLPQLAPAIAAGAALAFTLSLDDFVVSFFLASPDSRTLPLHIYGEVRRGLPPDVTALSTLVVLVTIALVVLALRLTRTPQPPR